MGFNDLEFGWQKSRFSLSDVKIEKRVALEVQDKDGSWFERDVPDYLFLKTDEDREAENKKHEETLKAARYSKPKRWLSAMGEIDTGNFCSMYLGIPENKQQPDKKFEARLEGIKITIHEARDKSLEHNIRLGAVNYSGEMEEMRVSGFPYISVYAPSSLFDDIERMADQSDVLFEIELHMMGWYWTGPIGDSEVYIDPENRYPVEFGGLIVTKKYTEKERELLVEDVAAGDYPKYYSQEAIETNVHLFNRLTEIGKVVDSAKVATWIAAFGVLAIAGKMWF